MTHCHVLRFFSFFCDSVPLVSEPQVASDILFNNFSLRCPIRCHDFVFHCCHGFVKDSEALAAFWWVTASLALDTSLQPFVLGVSAPLSFTTSVFLIAK